MTGPSNETAVMLCLTHHTTNHSKWSLRVARGNEIGGWAGIPWKGRAPLGPTEKADFDLWEHE